MKKLTLTFCALFALFAAAPAIFADGPEAYSGKKEVMQPAPPVCDFYRAHEWDLGIWGAYAFGSDTGQFDVPNNDPFVPDSDPTTVDIGTGFGEFPNPAAEQAGDNPNERLNIGQVSQNQLFGRDNSWGGGIDVKYFWSKYFGAGIEGVGFAAKTNFAGGGLLTLTARYPWGRFAPYVTGGLGFIGGGATMYKFFNEQNVIGTLTSGGETRNGFVVNEHEFWTTDPVDNKHIRGLGQIGVGMEYRITCHIGLMTDFTWNFVFGKGEDNKIGTFNEQGSDITELFGTVISSTPNTNSANFLKPSQGSDNQDFGMVRFGVTFAY